MNVDSACQDIHLTKFSWEKHPRREGIESKWQEKVEPHALNSTADPATSFRSPMHLDPSDLVLTPHLCWTRIR
jgi:hypothetical protein